MASRRVHTQGNPNSEILQSVENSKSLFRRRSGKEKASTSQTERSLFQEEFYSFQDLDLGLNVGNPMLRYKSDSFLKNTDINRHIFESYLSRFLMEKIAKHCKS